MYVLLEYEQISEYKTTEFDFIYFLQLYKHPSPILIDSPLYVYIYHFHISLQRKRGCISGIIALLSVLRNALTRNECSIDLFHVTRKYNVIIRARFQW